ncbi:hypothetical protein F511_19190 [Dorcoceras hygrometricum]|uniref:Uncharacterized protein n=1 Tax=Dorcoceras hygrometricum TaxID=472368 RepID=A0A2Z7AGM5_9LAMI|nr:hypothetical protein F511_19190 [Dorcoceras hygrometricum]
MVVTVCATWRIDRGLLAISLWKELDSHWVKCIAHLREDVGTWKCRKEDTILQYYKNGF